MKVFIIAAAVIAVILLFAAVQMLQKPQTAQRVSPAPAAQQPQQPYAGLRVCNKTSSRVSVAIGYKDVGKGWVTEGWWNAMPGNCEVVLPGPLRAKFYYVYAIDGDRRGEWGGHAFMCTQDKMFTIIGAEDCEKRGYHKNGFFEINTGELSTWMVQLDESGRRGLTP